MFGSRQRQRPGELHHGLVVHKRDFDFVIGIRPVRILGTSKIRDFFLAFDDQRQYAAALSPLAADLGTVLADRALEFGYRPPLA